MYKITVNKDTTYEVATDKDGLKLNGLQINWDLVALGNGGYHTLWNNKSYNIQIVKADAEAKTFVIQVNGSNYTLEVKDRFDQLLDKLGMADMASAKVSDIKAPMPGLVLEVSVTEGQELQKGDQVLILEAMKMENVLKSPGDGKVKAIKVKQGEAVEKAQVLIELE